MLPFWIAHIVGNICVVTLQQFPRTLRRLTIVVLLLVFRMQRNEQTQYALTHHDYPLNEPQQPRGTYGQMQTDPLEDVLGIFPCVKLRGLPFEATVGDILIFFQPISVLDIIFFVKDGKTTGEAVVLFSSVSQCESALQRNHQHMGRRYVEVFQAKRGDYYLAASLRLKSEQLVTGSSSSHMPMPSGGGYVPQHRPPMRQIIPSEHTGVIRMRGLPYNVTVEDIVHFFRAYNVRKDFVKISYRYDGRPTGEAFVTFDSIELASQALNVKLVPGTLNCSLQLQIRLLGSNLASTKFFLRKTTSSLSVAVVVDLVVLQ
eukprot:gene12439-26172_t